MAYLLLAPDAVRALAVELDGGSRGLSTAEDRVGVAISLAGLLSLVDWRLGDRSDRWDHAAAHLRSIADDGDALASAELLPTIDGAIVEHPLFDGLVTLRTVLGRGLDDRADDPGGTGDRVERRAFGIDRRDELDDAAAGRAAIAALLDATAARSLIGRDEFAVVEHQSGAVTIVLPGVTDLSNPGWGYQDDHRSARDLDREAVSSWQWAGIESNRYAELVRATILDLPAGTDVAIIGHSFGADTAADLATDPSVRAHVTISQVVTAGYNAVEILRQVPDDVPLLALESHGDLVAMSEARLIEVAWQLVSGQYPDPASGTIRRLVADYRNIVAPVPGHVLERLDGSPAGGGHHPSIYAGAVRASNNPDVEAVLAAFAASGHAEGGRIWTVDVTVPE